MGGGVLCCLLLLIEDELLVSHLPLIRVFIQQLSRPEDSVWVSCASDPAGEGEESPAASRITFLRSLAPNADILLNVKYSYGMRFTEHVKWF